MPEEDVEIDEDLIKMASGQFDFASVRRLCIHGLNIRRVQKLNECTALTHLDLSRNSINNEGLAGLACLGDHLQLLDLSSNSITELISLRFLTNLETLKLQNNRISDLQHVEHLTAMPKLRTLYFQTPHEGLSNPICKNKEYRTTVTRCCKALTCLDGSFFLRDDLDPAIPLKLTNGDDIMINVPRYHPWIAANFWDCLTPDVPQSELSKVPTLEAEFQSRVLECRKLIAQADESIENAARQVRKE